LRKEAGNGLGIEFTFCVLGTPQQRGSKISHPIYRNGKPVFKNGRVQCIARDQNDKKSKVWTEEVKAVAFAAMHDVGIVGVTYDPIEIEIDFYFVRPKSHYGSGKNQRQLRSSAPELHTKSPDLDKLCRCFGDALSKVVWYDDKQIYKWIASRHYTTEMDRTEVTIRIF